MKALLPLLVVPLCVFGDVGARQGGVYIGPARDFDCATDAGLYCSRDAGTPILKVRCVSATATEPGCITPSAQTFAGDKTLTGFERLVGTAHSSLTACDSSHKGMLQTCTTHGGLVYCDGSSNIELTGTAQGEQLLDSVAVNGVPSGLIGGATLNSNWTVNAIHASWKPGTTDDGGTFTISITDGLNVCACAVACDSPAWWQACTGNCSFSSGSSVAYAPLLIGAGGGHSSSFLVIGPSFSTGARLPRTSSCTRDPEVIGSLGIMGYSR